MVPALIIPASLLGFIAAMVRMFAFNASYLESALTYFVVCAIAPAVILWLVKTSDMRREYRTPLALPAQ
ncbi:MAG: hypothetical protein P8L32_03000 [Paracoccaceae bacterium]|jgi:hypothetical protein|nr:hypothetical protein [Paracoccaceae bacterium]